MEAYKNLERAMQIVAKARYEVVKDFGSTESPAWDKLFRIGRYLAKQADQALQEV